MAQSGTTTTTRSNGNGDAHAERTTISAVIAGAQDAATVARQSAERAAAHLPEAVASAQVAARDTQRALDDMDDQTLIAGASFAVGLGLGLFVSGAHRLLVAAALLPAGAIGLTLLRRDESSTESAGVAGAGSSRRSASRAQASS
jgi:hypothetical protein